MHKPLSSFSDLLNHYHKAAGHGVKTPSYFYLLCPNPFLFITYNLIYPLFFFPPKEPWESPGLFMDRLSFLLLAQVANQQTPCLTPAVSWASKDADDFEKNSSVPVYICRKMKENKTARVTKTQCHAVVWRLCDIFQAYAFVHVYVRTLTSVWDCKWERERENLMNCLIYGIHQRPRWFMGLITESIHKPAVLLFFCLWLDDRNTIAKPPICSLPILIQKPILAHICTVWARRARPRAHIRSRKVAAFVFAHALPSKQSKHYYDPKVILPMQCSRFASVRPTDREGKIEF